MVYLDNHKIYEKSLIIREEESLGFLFLSRKLHSL